MQAGKLNEIIDIYAPTVDVNEFGEQVQVYKKTYETRAEVVRNSGSRNSENDEIVYNHILTFKVRYYVSINENFQIKFQNKMYRVLNIDSINNWNVKIIEAEKIND